MMWKHHLVGGPSHLGYVVKNHGDHKFLKDQVVGPLPFMAMDSWLIFIGGDPITTYPYGRIRGRIRPGIPSWDP